MRSRSPWTPARTSTWVAAAWRWAFSMASVAMVRSWRATAGGTEAGGRRCGDRSPAGAVRAREVLGAGGQFGQDVGDVVRVRLAAQVGEEFAGLGGGSAGGAGDEFGLLPYPGRVHVRGVRRVGQAVRRQGHAVQGLGHGVVHLPGQAGPFGADRLGDGEPGPDRGQRLASPCRSGASGCAGWSRRRR